MIAVTIEIGDKLATLLGPLIVACAAGIGAWASTRRTKARVEETNAKVEQTHQQLVPNGGTSMRDVVDRMAVGQAQMLNEMRTLNTRLTALETSGLHAIDRRAALPPPPG